MKARWTDPVCELGSFLILETTQQIMIILSIVGSELEAVL